MRKEIIPAIIAKTPEEFEERINKVKDYVKILQLDFMDGKFVPNDSIDFDFELPETNCEYEAHLMINNPEEWIEKNSEKVDMILVHFESLSDGKPIDHKKIIKLVKEKGKKIGFVLNPETSIEKLKPYLEELDQVLIMAVNPGFYGSKFLPKMLDKVKELRKIMPEMDIEVDGGVTGDNIKMVNEAGANLFVSGSYIQKSENVKETVEYMKKLVR